MSGLPDFSPKRSDVPDILEAASAHLMRRLVDTGFPLLPLPGDGLTGFRSDGEVEIVHGGERPIWVSLGMSRRHDVDRLDCQIGMNEAAVEETDWAVPEDITQPELEELFDQVADWVIEQALLTLRRPRTASG
jgi:hypothetical protein